MSDDDGLTKRLPDLYAIQRQFTERSAATLRQQREIDSLGRALAGAVWVSFAYDIGHGHQQLERSGWYPGCGFPATAAVLACEWCGTLYGNGVNLEYKQATDCAAATYQNPDGTWYLVGHYGSRKHDMHRYRFALDRRGRSQHPGDTSIDPVCDRCIDKLIEEGVIVLVGDRLLE